MDVLHTPGERFTDLLGYPFAPRYVEVDGVRMHYVDEGPPDADAILLWHGEPSWSYLYRKVIPALVEVGHRRAGAGPPHDPRRRALPSGRRGRGTRPIIAEFVAAT